MGTEQPGKAYLYDIQTQHKATKATLWWGFNSADDRSAGALATLGRTVAGQAKDETSDEILRLGKPVDDSSSSLQWQQTIRHLLCIYEHLTCWKKNGGKRRKGLQASFVWRSPGPRCWSLQGSSDSEQARGWELRHFAFRVSQQFPHISAVGSGRGKALAECGKVSAVHDKTTWCTSAVWLESAVCMAPHGSAWLRCGCWWLVFSRVMWPLKRWTKPWWPYQGFPRVARLGIVQPGHWCCF